jgi:putative transposase
MQVSMSRRANAWESEHCSDAAIESFFKTLKVERIYQGRYETREQARLDIVDWIEGFYNRQRLHSSIGYRTPVELENMLNAA